MPTLLQIDSCLGVGSTGRITEAIGGLVKKEGWDCYVVHGARYTGTTSLHSIPAVTRFQEYLHAFGSMLFDKHGLFSARETKAVIRKLRTIKLDIVQLHCVHGYYINYKVLFEYLAEIKVPVVWTFHDCWAFTGHCAYFVSVSCGRWKTGCFECPLKGDYPKSILKDNSKKNWILKKDIFSKIENLTIVSVSEWLDALVQESFFRNKDSLMIYNGVDTTQFTPRDTAVREKYGLNDKFLLLAVATAWSKRKGFCDYIELSKRLSPDCRIVLVGLPENQQKKLPQNVIGVKKTNNGTELAEWYSAADVVLNLSYAETFGLTTVEGMACGTPGIVYNCTASPELITSETGFVVEPGNIDGVVKAIGEIRKKTKNYYTAACRARVMDNFNQESQFGKYLMLYNKLLNSNK